MVVIGLTMMVWSAWTSCFFCVEELVCVGVAQLVFSVHKLVCEDEEFVVAM